MKIHLRDLRLYNNAGISMPVCVASRPGHLDLEATGYTIRNTDEYRNAEDKSLFCAHCVRAWNLRYPWAPLSCQTREPSCVYTSEQPGGFSPLRG